MAEAWPIETQRRVTFLSVFDTLEGDYDETIDVACQRVLVLQRTNHIGPSANG